MDERRWVSAEPFRAHFNHVCAATATPWTVVAVNAGLPLGLVRDLLDVRPGRRVHRIAAELAVKVLAISAADVQALRVRMVPARRPQQLVRQLTAHGWSPEDLAGVLRISISEVDALSRGQLLNVTGLVNCRLIALSSARMRPPTGKLHPPSSSKAA